MVSYVSEELMVVWLLLIAAIVLAYFFQRRKLTWLPPSSSAMLLGVAAGVFTRVAGLSQPLRFSPAAFFYALLPPIVFDAGFTLKKKQFFKNFGAILTFAVLGTFISALCFGLGTYALVLVGLVRRSHLAGAPFVECLMYGAAISSIDPVATLAVLSEARVPPLLYNLVFGESVLNDAVSIVLFRSLQQFYDTPLTWGTLPAVLLSFCWLSLGSLLVGVGVALACAFVLKRFALALHAEQEHVHGDRALYEIAIVVMASYLAYLVAEVVGMSGIVALFFTGICHAHYSFYNCSPPARTTLLWFFAFAAFACETFVFAYLGLQVATMQHEFDFGLVFSALPLAVLSRAANVFPCSQLINIGRRYKLPKNLQSMLWAVGMRGAVAYGLVVNLPRADKPGETGIPVFETATLLIVVVSTLGLGSATTPLLRHFGLEGKDDADLIGIALVEDGLGEAMAPGQAAPRIEVTEHSPLHERFKELDELVLKPLFGGRQGATPPSRSYTDMHGLDNHHPHLGRYAPTGTAGWEGGGAAPAPPPAALQHHHQQQQQQQQQGVGGLGAARLGGDGGAAEHEIQMQQPGPTGAVAPLPRQSSSMSPGVAQQGQQQEQHDPFGLDGLPPSPGPG